MVIVSISNSLHMLLVSVCFSIVNSVASKHHLPIVSDEVYADMVFSGSTFHSVASLASNVPVLTCGGIAKRYGTVLIV